MQSNYGVVTKMGLWLMPAPPAYKPFSIRYESTDDIELIVETLRPLRIAGIIPNAFVIANVMWEAAAIIPRSKYYDGDGVTPPSVLAEIQKKEGVGAWNVYAALYGTPEQIEVNWNIIKSAVEKSGKGRFITEEEAGNTEPFKYRAQLMRGDMTLQEFGLYRWRGGGGSMWFAPVSQAKGSGSTPRSSSTSAKSRKTSCAPRAPAGKTSTRCRPPCNCASTSPIPPRCPSRFASA